jgi:putative hydrolase of the HAD superfamily
MTANRRIPCRAVFLDAGGVLVLPRRDLVARALTEAVGVEIDPTNVPLAHYASVRRLDRGEPGSYFALLCAELGVPQQRTVTAVHELERLADRRQSGEVLWSEPTVGALATIAALGRAGIAVLVVSNSDGHAEDNLRAAAVCQPGPGPGASVVAVIDSTLVGAEKPDARIFQIALHQARAAPERAAHVGDMLSTDIAGARAAGIEPLHFDPPRRCRARDHRHVRSLTGIWRHIARAEHMM